VIHHKRLLVMSLACSVMIAWVINARSDTLFRARQPVKIGYGKRDGPKFIGLTVPVRTRKTSTLPRIL